MPAPLQVGFDASAAALAQPTGVGLCLARLARALHTDRAELGLDLQILYRLSRARRRAHFLADLPARLYHERFSWSLARRLDVFHGPDSRLPRFSGPALVATVHDLSARRPGFSTDRFRATREDHWRGVVDRADLVVTYTDAIAREVENHLGVSRDRIAVVPLAPANAPSDPPTGDSAERILAAHTRNRPFVLVLGELSRRKNTVGAVRAFHAGASPEHVLVLVGPDGHGAEDVHATIAELGIADRVIRPAYVPAHVVSVLLANADALLFPSRYEGFGMPVLEAFRLDTPVVASLDPSVVEVAGGAALHADADDIDGLSTALRRAIEDGPCRTELIATGRARVADFSWAASARRLADVYRAAARREPSPSHSETSPCSP